jgi:ketosteroid isomerase-like protein
MEDTSNKPDRQDSAMHPNARLLQRLFTALNEHDHKQMAKCYHPMATFHDIAFDLKGKKQIHAMWHMICSGDIRATFEVVRADDREGVVRVVDEYTFSDTKRPVRNSIESLFHFRDGLIADQGDSCDPRSWAAMALGGARGFLAGRFRFLRSRTAKQKLATFIHNHPEHSRG